MSNVSFGFFLNLKDPSMFSDVVKTKNMIMMMKCKTLNDIFIIKHTKNHSSAQHCTELLILFLFYQKKGPFDNKKTHAKRVLYTTHTICAKGQQAFDHIAY